MGKITIKGDNSPAGILRYWERKSKPDCAREILRCWQDADQLRRQLQQTKARVTELELQVQTVTHYEETAARELLFWWAERLSNAPKEDMPNVVREGYQRIVNLANVLRKKQCTYPDCRCPFDMGPDHQCLKGLPQPPNENK